MFIILGQDPMISESERTSSITHRLGKYDTHAFKCERFAILCKNWPQYWGSYHASYGYLKIYKLRKQNTTNSFFNYTEYNKHSYNSNNSSTASQIKPFSCISKKDKPY